MNKTQIITTWLVTASVEGISRLMLDVNSNIDHFTDEQKQAIADLVNDDVCSTVAAKLSAAEENGLGNYETEIFPALAGLSFEDYLTIVHAVDVRLSTLPPEQMDEVGQMYEFGRAKAVLSSLTGGAPAAAEGEGEDRFEGDVEGNL